MKHKLAIKKSMCNCVKEFRITELQNYKTIMSDLSHGQLSTIHGWHDHVKWIQI